MKNIITLLITIASSISVCAQQTKQVSLTTPLDEKLWDKAQWISVADAPIVKGRVNDGTRSADGANWFCYTSANKKKVKQAVWMTTGLGIYDLYVNGELVGDEILKPGFTHYAKTKRAFTYNITSMLNRKKGAENKLMVQVTPGWWADKIITPGGHDGMIGKKCAFRGVLQLTYSDGTTETFGTNTHEWKAGIAGAIKSASIFDGIVYDANDANVNTIEFKAPEVNNEFSGEVLPTNGAEVYFRHDLTFYPQKIYVWKGVYNQKEKEYGTVNIQRKYNSGETVSLKAGETLVVDFGQNAAAVPSFSFNAKKGTKLTCLPAELLNDGNGATSRGMDGPEGSVHRTNLRAHHSSMRIEYTFADCDKTIQFCPRGTFFGYRYISITTTDDVVFYSIKSIPISSITKEMETGTLTTGNELINHLISNTMWSMRSNYLSVPTDCPQRNERLGWTADTQVFAETGSFFANTRLFLHKWMRDMRDTQNYKGGFPGVAPSAQYGHEDFMRVGWADAGVIVPWTVWKQFGDVQIIEENWQAMEKFILHVEEHKYDHPAYKEENHDYQWADWLSYEPLESCHYLFNSDKKAGEEYWSFLGASYWMIDAQMMADMARATGRKTEKYDDMVRRAKAYICERFLNTDGTFRTALFNTMQTPSLFVLRNKIMDGRAKENIIQRLRENFQQHDNCLQTGFLGTSILMQTLTDNGMTDIAYALLFQHKNPSWLYSVDNGATTIWERWNSYMKEHGMGPNGMNSFNHYAYGCVCQWLWETAAGISSDTNSPGFKHIILRPVPNKQLGSIKATYPSASGLIRSEWTYDDDGKWHWTFTIPKGTTASVTLPGETDSKEYKAGTYTIQQFSN